MENKIQLNDNVVLQKVDGKTVLFSKTTGDFFGLNESAEYLLKQIIANGLDATILEVSTQFKVPEAEIRSDLTSLLDELLAMKLIVKK